MRKRIGIYGITEEVLSLIPLLTANPGIEVVRTFAEDPDAVRTLLDATDPGVAALVEQTAEEGGLLTILIRFDPAQDAKAHTCPIGHDTARNGDPATRQ